MRLWVDVRGTAISAQFREIERLLAEMPESPRSKLGAVRGSRSGTRKDPFQIVDCWWYGRVAEGISAFRHSTLPNKFYLVIVSAFRTYVAVCETCR